VELTDIVRILKPETGPENAAIHNPFTFFRPREKMPEPKKVLYMGDDSLQGAAAYLGGVLTRSGIPFDYCPSSQSVDATLLDRANGLFIISDYAAHNLSEEKQKAIAGSVSKGASLLMIGGWESFHGLSGQYNKGPVSEILPVITLQADDRVNYCQGCVPVALREHPALAGLPWDRPPIFCGFNKVTLRDSAGCVLGLHKIKIEGKNISLDKAEFPLLVYGRHGQGRTCALTTDLAPHWVGGWVDWGEPRVRARAEGGNEVEVGCWYAQFIRQMVTSLL
jgi:hypothetical protein